jgi:hypothetical protein
MGQSKDFRIKHWLKHSVWVFPVTAFIILLLLSAFKINGSSAGIYYKLLYGKTTKDTSLIYGIPQPIRSDEWRVSTPLTTLQAKTGYPIFNKDLGTGHDVALSQDAPVKNWLGIFRPQNYSFFILPFENAYAFRWWVVMYLLLMATYFFILRLFPGQKLLAIILSTAFTLSPYFLWWYQAPMFLPFAYALFGMIIGMRIINREKIPWVKSRSITNLLYSAALVYLGVSAALLIYAPFLIPAAIVVVAFLVGYLLDNRSPRKLFKLGTLKQLAPFGLALLLIGCIGILLIAQHHEAISRIGNSEYPGHRIINSGALPYSHLFPFFGGFLQPLLQSASHGLHYFANQSEASNFIFLLPFLLIPGIFVQIYEYRKHRRVSYVFLLLQIVAILFLVRISLSVGDFFYRFLLLDRVPNARLMAGIGFVGFLQMLYLIKSIEKLNISPRLRDLLAVIYGAACFIVLFIFGLYVRTEYPQFLHRYILLIGFTALFTAIIISFLANKKMLGASLLLIFTLGSSFRILPLYRGLDFFENSAIVKKMDNVSGVNDKWVVIDNENYESMPMIAGRGNIGGHQMYADLDLWHQMDKSRQYEHVYNRQGHVLFLSNTLPPNPTARFNVTSVSEDFELVKGNLFKVRFSCSDFTYINIQFALTTHPVGKECMRLISVVPYPKTSFYIYEIVQPNQ